MKTNLLKAVAFAMVMTPLYNCSVEPVEQELQLAEIANEQTLDDTPCSGEDPKARVTNDSDNVVNFEIFDGNGALVNYVYGLNPGETSDWRTFPVGITTFSISTSESSKPVRIDMGLCMAYDVTINENNQLDTDVPIQL
ncbi:hypothetical protein M0G43_09950 [Subsaxibacter sp. CAU 1640]|uniref:hypothetical protein n=1 Tax=Subsaxibacter sp. CAU 1640 TaxID=2933271 RepID=UPI0020065EE6|nr:hypothetical protein [Subsaxibacter sp. CAU 1640]MCK7590893.1 hypothetical protein [Subsaxibacter sp. CAU 1640]